MDYKCGHCGRWSGNYTIVGAVNMYTHAVRHGRPLCEKCFDGYQRLQCIMERDMERSLDRYCSESDRIASTDPVSLTD